MKWWRRRPSKASSGAAPLLMWAGLVALFYMRLYTHAEMRGLRRSIVRRKAPSALPMVEQISGRSPIFDCPSFGTARLLVPGSKQRRVVSVHEIDGPNVGLSVVLLVQATSVLLKCASHVIGIASRP